LPGVVRRHLQEVAADRTADTETLTEREDEPLLAVETRTRPLASVVTWDG
jgi:hypothetical protein